eukprot:scaffold650_cov407-Prasinococcus_capsulatus_cf.AAC.6
MRELLLLLPPLMLAVRRRTPRRRRRCTPHRHALRERRSVTCGHGPTAMEGQAARDYRNTKTLAGLCARRTTARQGSAARSSAVRKELDRFCTERENSLQHVGVSHQLKVAAAIMRQYAHFLAPLLLALSNYGAGAAEEAFADALGTVRVSLRRGPPASDGDVSGRSSGGYRLD